MGSKRLQSHSNSRPMCTIASLRLLPPTKALRVAKIESSPVLGHFLPG